mmetsp:Transcript_773/g.2341  ORF Transcript_773/g.2341 Transcript_773/m.2341 type:complete len:265 (+) Transcript_773:152-946(+)
MGVDEAHQLHYARVQAEHLPPRRLSSFLNQAVQQQGAGAFMMDESAAARAEAKHSKAESSAVQPAQPRARKAIVRQNSNLTDSILTQRSLFGTAGGAPVMQSGMHGIHGSQHKRVPQRTSTGIQSFRGPAGSQSPSVDVAALRSGPQPPAPQKVLWTGQVKHSSSGNMVELCTLVCMLPFVLADQFPTTLFIKELVLRDNVQLDRHVMVNCSLHEPSTEQQQNLAMMSHMKLTGVIRLQHCEFTVCPVVDTSGEMKVIGFLLPL